MEKLELHFPKDLYSDVRIEDTYRIFITNQNNELIEDGDYCGVGIMIRVFDGRMWYTASTNDYEKIQEKLDELAKVATPNPDIYEHPMIQKLEVYEETILKYQDEKSIRMVSRDQLLEIIDHYKESCIDLTIPDTIVWGVGVSADSKIRQFYSSKGTYVCYDEQYCYLNCGQACLIHNNPVAMMKNFCKRYIEDLNGLEEIIIKERDRYLEYYRNAKDIEPGEYTCVLAPFTTAMFTHESFGHRSEADYILNDKSLQEKWVIGKKVANENVSICDNGELMNHGYTPYDDEGSKAKETWLIKDGILAGRLHNAKSASVLDEELTGNCRAQGYICEPIVRMTNTFMQASDLSPEELIQGVKNGIYVYSVSNGTGDSTFVLNPTLCYRIRDGKLAEPVKVHMITGNVFQTLFDIDGVGNDLEIFDTYTCGKNGQTVNVSAGGPTIRVSKMSLS